MIVDKEFIKKNKKHISDTKHRGIYLLIDEDEIVYVGQTSNFNQRIFIHIVERKKNFDSFLFIESNENLDDLESYYTRLFMPKYNISSFKENDQIKRAKKLGWNGEVQTCHL